MTIALLDDEEWKDFMKYVNSPMTPEEEKELEECEKYYLDHQP